ncbi:hypothetical protein LP416_27885 [Polaromonas sp. P2-4]|nr:hypothetical protein LP416_27885 [Polaromonas sp. P2-4]
MNDAVYQPPQTEPSDEEAFLLIDAESAQGSVGALVEILGGCTPGQQVTGVFMRSLLADVKMHLDNVVDGLRHRTASLPLHHSRELQ